MKRPLTLTSAILGTVFYSLLAVSLIINLITHFFVSYGPMYIAELTTIEIIAFSLAGALTLVGLFLNIFSIVAWNKDKEQFRKRRDIIISATAFNFALVVILSMGLVLQVGVSTIAALEILALVASSVLYIIDLSLENNRNNQKQNDVKACELNREGARKVSLSFEEKLIIIHKLKEQGLINEEESSELKKKIINEFL